MAYNACRLARPFWRNPRSSLAAQMPIRRFAVSPIPAAVFSRTTHLFSPLSPSPVLARTGRFGCCSFVFPFCLSALSRFPLLAFSLSTTGNLQSLEQSCSRPSKKRPPRERGREGERERDRENVTLSSLFVIPLLSLLPTPPACPHCTAAFACSLSVLPLPPSLLFSSSVRPFLSFPLLPRRPHLLPVRRGVPSAHNVDRERHEKQCACGHERRVPGVPRLGGRPCQKENVGGDARRRDDPRRGHVGLFTGQLPRRRHATQRGRGSGGRWLKGGVVARG